MKSNQFVYISKIFFKLIFVALFIITANSIPTYIYKKKEYFLHCTKNIFFALYFTKHCTKEYAQKKLLNKLPASASYFFLLTYVYST